MKILYSLVLGLIPFFCFSQHQWLDFSKDSFHLKYPENWFPVTSGKMGTVLFVFSPLENEEDKFSENINVIIQELSGREIDLAAYKKITETQIKEYATDPELYESTIVSSGKGEYYKVSYAMTQGKLRLKIISYCLIKNQKGYLITFGSEVAKYEQYKTISEEMLSSFSVE